MFSFRAISSSLTLFPSYRVPLALAWVRSVLVPRRTRCGVGDQRSVEKLILPM